eukprot:Cvel_6128.t1-p1 / transcript=Cvel_6128.t1 / gene=Cvel_6128 / organism=Chromera_velia_CCMP2878 / gene_product=hypothetical protein / transcript_product=hypothetical protein / location=Cvel_scaffold296:13440-13964(-) / protein_length=175 / sequence_SO=supercontig / SO=protein_coding / is_pseudo=false
MEAHGVKSRPREIDELQNGQTEPERHRKAQPVRREITKTDELQEALEEAESTSQREARQVQGEPRKKKKKRRLKRQTGRAEKMKPQAEPEDSPQAPPTTLGGGCSVRQVSTIHITKERRQRDSKEDNLSEVSQTEMPRPHLDPDTATVSTAMSWARVCVRVKTPCDTPVQTMSGK